LDDFIKDLLKVTGNEYASIAADGIIAGDITGWYDSGSYSLNALLSGSIYLGYPNNKIVGFAGEEATGKSFYALKAIDAFLGKHPNGIVVLFESESAQSRVDLEARGINTNRIVVAPVATIEEFRTQASKILTAYEAKKVKDRVPMFFVLDSLGNLSSVKELADIESGSDKRDMTKQQLIRGAFRTLTLKLGKLQIPMIVVAHTYQVVVGSYVPIKEIGGGQGVKYACSIILTLSKKQAKDGDDRIGSIITTKLYKSRITRVGLSVETLLRFDGGLDRYFGLLELAEKFGVVTKEGTKYIFPNGESNTEAKINRNPEKYFTKDVLDLIDAKCKEEFKFGDTIIEEENQEEDIDEISN
jgi:RecA/RadA recombinase